MPATSIWKATIIRLWVESRKVAAGRAPFALFICGLLAYGASYAWHMLASFDLVNLIRDVNGDDSFYYFQIAYNLAQGKFSTFDGGITQTNGYHPVWLLLITPFYWLFDKETALFGIKAFEIMLVAGGAALIALAARVARLAWLLLFAALPTLYRNAIELLYGLEAAAAMFALSLLILAVCLYMRNPPRWKWPLAALAFALPWVRIEYIAISLAVTAALCVIEWSRLERRALRLSELANIRYAYIPLIGAVVGILVYFAYNELVFGGALPVSAATKQTWSQALWAQEGGYSFAQNFLGTLRLEVFDYELLIAFEICAYLLIVWQIALRSKDRRDWLLVAFLVGVFGLAAGHLAKFAQIVLTMHPDDSKIWYFVPAYLMTALIIPVRLYVAIYLIRRFLAPRRRLAANALSAGVFVIGAAILLVTASFAEPFKQVDYQSRSTHISEWEINSYMGVQVLNRALPEGSVIGSWDSGVIGYFSRFPVVNLDGLVNSYDFFRARHIIEIDGYNYYRRYGITHFANAHQHDPATDDVIFRNHIFEGILFDHGESERQFRIWTYPIPPPETRTRMSYSQEVWDNMTPRFDYLSNRVGVVLAGRTAQAFARGCLPNDPMVWTWSERKYERAVSLEINPYRNRMNMCVDSRVLPRSADQTAQANMTTLSAYFANLMASNEPIIRSDFDVYIADGSLIYAKEQCSQDDVEQRFFASIFPVDTDDLPDSRKQHGYSVIDFNFEDYGTIDNDGRCWAEATLPDYPVDSIHTGQYVEVADGYYSPWEGYYKAGVADRSAGAESELGLLADREPVIRSDFDVYLIDNRLIYAKEQCSQDDVEPTFFASIFPVDRNDLPYRYRVRGYDGADFSFHDYGAITGDGRCWAAIDLPNYPVAEIYTGQYIEVNGRAIHTWDGLYVERAYEEHMRRAGAEADFGLLAGRKPVIRGRFDVYLIGDRLIYAKSQCSHEDIAARFFVSIFPAYVDALSDDRKPHGYDTVEFNFGDYGVIADDGRCWAAVDLPNYPIAEIHTGQYVAMADGYEYPWEGAHHLE